MSSSKFRIAVAVGVVLVIGLGVGTYFMFWAKPSSTRAQISYTIGAQFGRSLKTQDLDLDASALSRGMRDGLKKDNLALSESEMQAALMRLNEDRQKQIQAEALKNKSTTDDFLSRNRVSEGVKSTPSGLQYKVLKEGTGPSPKGDDVVVVNYRGTLVDGTEFDSSFRRNQPAEFPVKGVIPGWTEGLLLMKKGGKAMFYIPPELGYGDRPRQNIPPNSVLVFDVELVNVKAASSVPNKSPSAPQRHEPAKPAAKPKK